jgi:hypothetical protein
MVVSYAYRAKADDPNRIDQSLDAMRREVFRAPGLISQILDTPPA